MSARIRPLVAGNWKMNGLRQNLAEIDLMGQGYDPTLRAPVDLLVCPPLALVHEAASLVADTGVAIGAQDCCANPNPGAFTGDVSALMIADAGASYAILGHSERRQGHGETDALVKAKATAALAAGLTAIVCVGETRGERESGQALAVVARQLAGSLPPVAEAGAGGEPLVVAYEPVWAIGTGLVPDNEQIAAMHAHIRARLIEALGDNGAGVRILYGGSVKPDNAGAIMALPHVNGVLVGGASLKAADFLAIARACAAAPR